MEHGLEQPVSQIVFVIRIISQFECNCSKWSCRCLMSVSILLSLLTHGHQDKGNAGKAPTNPLERGLSPLPRLSKRL